MDDTRKRCSGMYIRVGSVLGRQSVLMALKIRNKLCDRRTRLLTSR
jgi:hypothetical protein